MELLARIAFAVVLLTGLARLARAAEPDSAAARRARPTSSAPT